MVGIGLGLIVMLTASAPGTQLRVLLDSLIVSAAIFGASWMTLLHTVYAVRAESVVSVAASLAYPVVDIALITIASLMLLRAPAERRPQLGLLTAGLASIAISDTAFAYHTATDGYHEHHVIALGWAWGFLAIALAALAARRTSRSASEEAASSSPPVSGWLPYVPVLLSVVLCTPMLIAGLGPAFVAVAVSVLALVVRQFLVLAENRRLRAEVASQALRDPMTGLANRTLFEDRLDHAMQLHRRHGLTVAVLLINLEQQAPEDQGS